MSNPPSNSGGNPSKPAIVASDVRGEVRFSANRKIDLVLRLFRGESLDAVSRDANVPVSRLSEWREAFLAHGKEGLKSRGVQLSDMTDEQRRALQAKIGEITMENELLRAKIAHMEAGLPPALRRSKR